MSRVLGWPEVRFRWATRGSTLAMIQAQLAAEALARRYPQHEFTPTPLTTHGDRHPSMRLSESPREGVFVKDLEQALLDGRAELAVHSAKDLPTLPTPGLTLAAFLPREDARDALIARPPATLAQLPAGARIGTGSPRRAAQIAAIRPDLQAVEIRGNVDTPLRRRARPRRRRAGAARSPGRGARVAAAGSHAAGAGAGCARHPGGRGQRG